VHELFTGERAEKEKSKYVYTLKRFVERHNLVIPCIFEDLIRSMRNAAFDENGRIRKRDDHSFDSLLYAISYYGEVADQSAFWKAMRGEVIAEQKRETEEERKKREAKEAENLRKTGNKGVEVIEDWEKAGWSLHTYACAGNAAVALGTNHYLLFEKGE